MVKNRESRCTLEKNGMEYVEILLVVEWGVALMRNLIYYLYF